ncbi:hypothetical protein [Anaerosacchariphilus polymeriproducens]|uniref:Uncharacterized protein n=1 Tax=Anaerosacchariphilus polymeriproducens TaxID=1812858 RepID=A0A371AWN4_9FIRM|nr:hypothetical protein [Anaerosacchariphilus polymeriproducens]RDU23996.1 hypothetical protein DWV06_06800 [Anaerosacchariphilus polymeriproducens]
MIKKLKRHFAGALLMTMLATLMSEYAPVNAETLKEATLSLNRRDQSKDQSRDQALCRIN